MLIDDCGITSERCLFLERMVLFERVFSMINDLSVITNLNKSEAVNLMLIN